MKKIGIKIGILLLLTACQNKFFNNLKSISSFPEPKVSLDQLKPPLKISVVNKSNEGYLELSDKLSFHGFEGLNLNNSSSSSEKDIQKMKISSHCSVNDKKTFKEIQIDRYQFEFSVIDLLPDELLFKNTKDFMACSFFFQLTDTNKNKYHFALTQHPLHSIESASLLALKNADNETLSFLPNSTIQLQNIDDFFLISESPKNIDKISLTCNNNFQALLSNDKSQLSFPIFRRFYSEQDTFPDDLQECRIITQKNNISNGITKTFKIDFSTFKNQNTISPDIDALTLKLDYTPSQEFFQPDKLFWHVQSERLDSKQQKRLPDIDLPYKYTQPNISSVFKFGKIPKDFLNEKYDPINVKVQTKCINDSFENKLVEKTYTFPFTHQFPLMKVTPENVFQMNYPEFLRDPNHKKTKKNFLSEVHIHKRSPIQCSYKFQLHNIKTNEIKNFKELLMNVEWNSGGFGVTFDNQTLKEGYPVFLDEIITKGSNIHFTYQNLNKHLKASPPDVLRLKCSPGFGEKKDFEMQVSLTKDTYFFPFSALLEGTDFKLYLKSQYLTKCRLLLYKNNKLDYFSHEIHILDKGIQREFYNKYGASYPEKIKNYIYML